MEKMIFKKVVFFLCTLMISNSYAQNSHVIIKFCPMAAADVINFPTIQGGVEFKLSQRISWYNELGIKYRDGLINQTYSTFIKSNGFKLKSEVRYYFQNKGRRHFSSPGYYFAANAFFTQDQYNTQVEYRSNNTNGIDAFGIKKRIFGMNLLAGRQFSIYKNLMLDAYGGIGFRLRSIKTLNQEYNKNTDTLHSTVDITLSSIKAEIDTNLGTHIVPNFTMGFRLCFKL